LFPIDPLSVGSVNTSLCQLWKGEDGRTSVIGKLDVELTSTSDDLTNWTNQDAKQAGKEFSG
jgi:hypothetical protein